MSNISISESSEDTIHLESTEPWSPDTMSLPASMSGYFRTVQCVSILLILTTNGSLIFFIMKQLTRTFLDWMVVFDSVLCIINAQTIATIGFKFHSFCYLNIFVAYFVNIANRLLSLGIVLYRCVLVLVVGRVQTSQRRRLLSASILGSILSLSLALTAAAVYYKEAFKRFLSICIVQMSTTYLTYLQTALFFLSTQRVLGACTSSTTPRGISTWP